MEAKRLLKGDKMADKNVSYYITQAIRKPYLIRDAIFKRHLGIIIAFKTSDSGVCNNMVKFDGVRPIIEKCFSSSEIFHFYQKHGRSSLSYSKISEFLRAGNDCWVIKLDDKIIGATWVLFGKVNIPQFSGRCLSSKQIITFEPDVGYICYSYVERKYRGLGLNKSLLNELKQYYKAQTNIKRLIAITGANNAGYI